MKARNSTRAERMCRYLDGFAAWIRVSDSLDRIKPSSMWNGNVDEAMRYLDSGRPLPNVWAGVSAEDRRRADERIPYLAATSAAVRFVSAEPLLEDLGAIDLTGIDWLIVGGESGPGARSMHPDWVRSLRDQCQAAGKPFFFKQWGEWIGVTDLRDLPGGDGPGFGHYDHCQFDMATESVRVGKKTAGRLLDGRSWDEMPEARHG